MISFRTSLFPREILYLISFDPFYDLFCLNFISLHEQKDVCRVYHQFLSFTNVTSARNSSAEAC